MLLSLISLNDDEITIVTDTVRQWCCERKLDIDSIEDAVPSLSPSISSR